ncbi:FAD-dependent oxidoreductase [Miltoncostaea marina]|uniref:FAD-dependent oxidoreductase n=1 Tax=Miltoncostaea marina TaxID=2843215 RepID=UPI001C3CEADA|nr:FAD-dependent oxidoreductase [Miltoncostaea marina]
MGEPHRICVIGGGAAGISAGSMAKRTNPDATVVVCTEFEDVAYSPCGIPYVLGREIPDFERLFLAGPENYAEAGIDLRTQTAVTEVDVANRTMTANGDVVPWDRLVVCTGWNYTLPDVPGNDLEGLVFVKNIRRGIELNETLDDVKKAVVLEAGPLGVEMLTALAHRGIETHLVDENAWLLAQIADQDIAEPVQTSLEELGCQLHFGVGLRGFVGENGRLRAVDTTQGQIEADICVISTHKEPETTLARAMGLKIGSTGALVVDERMRTSMEDVYAAGDVVEVPQNLTGIAVQGLTGSHAMQQGRVAGANAAGGDRRYDPVNLPWGMVGGQVQIGGASLGENLATSLGIPYVVGSANGISRARYFPGVQQVRVKLLAEPGTGRLIGGQFVGGEGIKERADFLAFALKRGATLEDLAWMENVYSPPIGALYEPLSVAAQNGMAQL